jgi:hypothetical protein
MKKQLKSDSGFALGLVLIFVLGVGSILGSVMMITQLSADSQGRGVEQLATANKISVEVSNVFQDFEQAASQNYALQLVGNPNCGLPAEVNGVSINCQLEPSADPGKFQGERVSWKTADGSVVERNFSIVQDPTVQVQHVLAAGQ